MDRIFIAGHNGLTGKAITRALSKNNNVEIICKSKQELDLTNQQAVKDLFQSEKIDRIIISAAKVGGIHANNTYPAEFIYINLMIVCNIVHQAYKAGIFKILSLGSSCIYPKYSQHPIKEEYLLTGKLELSNEPYAIAKIAGIKLCESYNRQFNTDYRSVMPTNLYGPGDKFHELNSHVLPALLHRFHTAKINNFPEVTIWGTGKPRRDLLYVDDLADAILKVCFCTKEEYNSITEPMTSHINIGSGNDISILELAKIIAKITDYHGKLIFDHSKPDGVMKKVVDISKMKKLNWHPKTTIYEGITKTYDWYLKKIQITEN